MSAVASVAPIQGAWHLNPFRFRSAAASHAGCVRRLNEDAWLDRSEVGLWAVADGMGGHEAGEVASAAVVAGLSRVSVFSSAFAFRRAVRSALISTNEWLQRKSSDELTGLIGSTVVTLLAHQGHYACIWAGDSRAYILRRGQLQQITRDHSLIQEMIDAGSLESLRSTSQTSKHVVTRAVGAQPQLDLDGVYGHIEIGDRFLLCSDGVVGVLDDAELRSLMGQAPLDVAINRMMRTCLDRGAPDNITLVLLEADRA